MPESEAEARATSFPTSCPLTVITAEYLTYSSDPTKRVAEPPVHREVQANLAGTSSLGKQVLAEHSGHLIQLDQPELVIDAVREMVAKWRASRN